MIEFQLQELESATDDFSPSRLIGKGSHGSVYRGTLPNKKLVAIKKRVQNEEALILSSIISHSCLVSLLGTSHDRTVLVTEYMPNGTLDEALHAAAAVILPWPRRIHIALQIAKALAFLHETMNIVHRDVKSTNVLLDENWDAKLADFGLALRLNDDVHLPAAGTMGYIDPCYTKPTKLSTKVDVYSYGVLLLEIVSGRKAIDVLHSPASIVEWALPLIEERRFLQVCDKRTRYVEAEIDKMLTIAVRCVCLTQDLRPLMSQIVVEVEKIITGIDSIPTFPFMMISFLRDIVVNTMKRRRRIRKSDANMARETLPVI